MAALVGLLGGRPGQEALEHDQEEGRGLAGPGLGLPGDVPPGQRDGKGLRLDRGAVGEAGVGESLEDARVEVEAVEACLGEVCLCHQDVGFLLGHVLRTILSG
jgi:hypothetical protein